MESGTKLDGASYPEILLIQQLLSPISNVAVSVHRSKTCEDLPIFNTTRGNMKTRSPRPTQPPTLSGTGNEYRPKSDEDALRLGSIDRYGSYHLWMYVMWVVGKTV